MSNGESILKSVVERFAIRYRLTVRESDVLVLLCLGISTVKTIAERLSISENTVHNHVKNIFRRTGTKSKSSLVALALKELVVENAGKEMVSRPVSVLLIEPDSFARARLRTALEPFSMHITESSSLLDSPGLTAKSCVDVVIADVAAHDRYTGSDLVTSIYAHYGTNTLIMLTASDNSLSETYWLERGVSKVCLKPNISPWLGFDILEALADPFTLSRIRRVDTMVSVRVNNELDVESSNFGIGGAFLMVPRSLMETRGLFSTGQLLRVSFSLQGHPIEALGQIKWLRLTDRPSMPSGVGLCFQNIDEAQHLVLEAFVRSKKLASLSPRAT